MKRRPQWYTLTALAILLSPGVASTQETQQRELPPDAFIGGVTTPIDFLPPGARSLGMGGAFIGLADDATAAESNPAGLTILTRSEVSIHIRNSAYQIPFESPGAGGATRFMSQFPNHLSPASDSSIGALDDSVTSASFISFVMPFRALSLSMYYQETAHLQADSELLLMDAHFFDFYHYRDRKNETLRQLGGAIGYAINDRISIGGSVRRTTLDVQSTSVVRVDNVIGEIVAIHPLILRRPLGSFTQFEQNVFVVDDSDTDTTYNLGILVKLAANFKVGAVYKRGGEFSLGGSVASTRCRDLSTPSDPASGLPLECPPGAPENTGDFREVSTLRKLPNFFGAGLTGQFMDQTLTLAIDVNRIEYSRRSIAEGELIVSETMDSDSVSVFEAIRNTTVLRVGAEKVFVLPYDFLSLVSVRGGVFNDPDHDGFLNIDASSTHVTFGLGAVFGGNFQIDFASEFSDPVDNILFSAIYRFQTRP